jgi:two-component system, cell cycle sensor histidine kinase and response regulator CckA
MMQKNPSYEELENKIKKLRQVESERIKAVEALRDSENRFRAIFNHAPYPIVINRFEDGILLDANKAFLESRNITEEEMGSITSKNLASLTDAEAQTILDHLESKGSLKNLEATVLRSDGSQAHILCSSVLLEIQGQKQILSMTVDMTERKRAEEALKKSEDRFRKLFKMAPLPMAHISLDGSILDVNDRLKEAMGYTIEDVPTLEHAWNLAMPDPDLRNQVTSTWLKAMEAAKADNTDIDSFECPLHYKDGTVHTNVIGTELIGETIIVSFFDITERKKAEEATEFERQQLLSIFNSLNEIIYVSDPFTFEVLFANQRLKNLIGKDPTGGLCYKELQGVDRPCDFCTNQIILNNGGMPHHWEYKNPVTNIDVAIVDQIIRWPDGRPVRLEIAVDITERKRAEEEREKLQAQLLQSQKLEAVGILAGGVAHDFNNMLGAIIGYAELTMSGMDPKDPFRKNLHRILDAAQRSGNLTRQLLAFARKQNIEPVLFDLNKAIEAILKMIRRLIGENIELAWLPGAGSFNVKMDPSQFDQILLNLCVNARDAITDVGRITIETETVSLDDAYCQTNAEFLPGQYVLLAVSDNGSGMNKETLDHIFEPFFTTKETGKGTGMGLATVYGIVKQNQGLINVYSESGWGTTFRVYLPLSDIETVEGKVRTDEKIPLSRGETILIVEDESALLELSMMMLQNLGYEVLSAETPSEAIRILKENRSEISLFITDVVMPEMNGRDLAEQLRKIQPGIKHLFMSGYSADVIGHQGILDRGVDFIQKPFGLKDLAVKIRAVLDHQLPEEGE